MIQKKIVTCGSVDDGKSTLIGRIIFETKNLLNDQDTKLKKLSKRYGTTGKDVDLALLLDGLQDEREQGITIDVAHKYINYKNQRLVFHDSPGHDQYTKNVVTAASNCDLAILLVDSSKGVLEQTKRHLKILEFLNIKNLIFAVNKIDLISFNQIKFKKICNDLKLILNKHKTINTHFIPVSGLKGDNVVTKSKRIKWYKDKSVLDVIVKTKITNKKMPTFLSVQHVHRPNRTVRNYFGELSGSFSLNHKIKVLPGGSSSQIKNIYTNFKKIKKISNTYMSLSLKNELDIVRGDVITSLDDKTIKSGNAFNANIVVTSQDKIIPGREYLLRIHNKVLKMTVLKVKNSFNFKTNNFIQASELNVNELGEIEFSTNQEIAFSTFDNIPQLGRFVIIDNINFNVVAAGTINFELRRSTNIFASEGGVNKKIRSSIKKQKPICIWLTGLSGAGKTTIAQALEKELVNKGKHTYVLDGDNLRSGINKNLGFSSADRSENIRRVAEISKLMVDSGLITIVSVISPFEKERVFAKSLFEKDEFFEIYLNTPLSVCLKRDPKKLYKKAKTIKGFNKIGLTTGYEVPKNPYLKIDTSKESIERVVNKIIKNIF